MAVGETETPAIDCRGHLNGAETVSSVSSIIEVDPATPHTEVSPSDLTIDNIAVSTGVLTIDGNSVPLGQAIQYRILGQQAGKEYTLLVTFITSGGRTKKAWVGFPVEGP